MKKLLPDSIAGRTFLVLLLGLTVSHALSVAMYVSDRLGALEPTGGEHIAERIATVSRLVESASQAERLRIVELADGPALHVAWGPDSEIAEAQGGDWQTEILREALIDHFDKVQRRNFEIRYVDADVAKAWNELKRGANGRPWDGKFFLVSVQLSDSSWLRFTAPLEPPEPLWSLRFVISMVVMISAVVIFSAIVVYHMTAPLRIFARAAQRLGTDVNAPPLSETGPIEVRRASRAFNVMQERIRRFVKDRTQMIAAISHDLRTPITRLRLRAEFIEDEEQHDRMLADLDEMEAMISSTLSFARDDVAGERRQVVDLVALLRSACDDLGDVGQPVEFRGDGRFPYNARPIALRRAFTNLIENALKYGKRARVELAKTKDSVVVQIDDDGPGIPESEQEKAFAPFYRLENSRSRDTGGAGLGLAFTRSVIRTHGGEIKLVNRPEGGLRVEVTLPK